jgi:hypothetical protein
MAYGVLVVLHSWWSLMQGRRGRRRAEWETGVYIVFSLSLREIVMCCDFIQVVVESRATNNNHW